MIHFVLLVLIILFALLAVLFARLKRLLFPTTFGPLHTLPPTLTGSGRLSELVELLSSLRSILGSISIRAPDWSFVDTGVSGQHPMLLFPSRESVERGMRLLMPFSIVSPAPCHASANHSIYSYKLGEFCTVTFCGEQQRVFTASGQSRVEGTIWFPRHEGAWIPYAIFLSYSYRLSYSTIGQELEVVSFHPVVCEGNPCSLLEGTRTILEGEKELHYLQLHPDGVNMDIWSESVPVSRTLAVNDFYDALRFYQAASRPTASTLSGALPTESMRIIPWVYYLLSDVHGGIETHVFHYQRNYVVPLDDRVRGQDLPPLDSTSAFVPVQSSAAGLEAYTQRILPGRVVASCGRIEPRDKEFAVEFAMEILRRTNQGRPLDPISLSEVMEHKLCQPKHLKERETIAVIDGQTPPRGRMFTKTECYNEAKDLRPVVGFNVDYKNSYSRFTAALSSLLAMLPFFMALLLLLYLRNELLT
jgi:hypothetical protein